MEEIKFKEYEIDILKNLVIDEMKELYDETETEGSKRSVVNAGYWYKIDLDKIKDKLYSIEKEIKDKEYYEDLPFN